ncbi:MAG: hypothetical protein QXZ44_07105 [Ferroplasma sp.]
MAILKIFRTTENYITELLSNYSVDRLLISDGIILGKEITGFDVKIQRVLTPYQLENILISSSERMYYIVISSDIFDSWTLLEVHELYYIMEQKKYNGSSIILELYGRKTVNEMLMA